MRALRHCATHPSICNININSSPSPPPPSLAPPLPSAQAYGSGSRLVVLSEDLEPLQIFDTPPPGEPELARDILAVSCSFSNGRVSGSAATVPTIPPPSPHPAPPPTPLMQIAASHGTAVAIYRARAVPDSEPLAVTWTLLTVLHSTSGPVHCVSFSTVGNRLLTGGARITLWSTRVGCACASSQMARVV